MENGTYGAYGSPNGYPGGYPNGYPGDPGAMEAEALRKEIGRRQKKLIPVNIVVMLLCLVAVFSLLFLPLVSIDASSLAELMPASADSGTDGSADGSAPSESDGTDALGAILGGVELHLSVTGKDLLRLGFSSAPDDVLFDMIDGTLSSAAEALAANMIALMGLSGSEDADAAAVETDPLTDALRALETAQGDAEIDAAISSLVSELQAQLGADVIDDATAADLRDGVREQYDETVRYNDGVFTTEAFVCVAVSSVMNEGGEGEVYTTFGDLVAAAVGTLAEDGGEDPLASDTVKLVCLAAAVVTIFFAFVWAVLFLFAFFRLFAKNKRFLMWYVKIFGILPCLLFGVLPLAAGALIGGEIAAVLGMLSTMAWVSGGCYVLLWLVSIFWAFPIKRKIRALNKQLAQLG